MRTLSLEENQIVNMTRNSGIISKTGDNQKIYKDGKKINICMIVVWEAIFLLSYTSTKSTKISIERINIHEDTYIYIDIYLQTLINITKELLFYYIILYTINLMQWTNSVNLI